MSDFDRAIGDPADWWLHVPAETLQVALTLNQSIWWVDSESTPHLIDVMSSRHRQAVLQFLRGRAGELLLTVLETQARARPGSAAGTAATALLGDGVALGQAQAWLEETPLLRRLTQLER